MRSRCSSVKGNGERVMASCRLSNALTKKKSQPASRVSGLPGYHANPTRRYQTLRSMKGAPNLPSGYASMIGLTYFPPLWRRVIDHRVLDHYADCGAAKSDFEMVEVARP